MKKIAGFVSVSTLTLLLTGCVAMPAIRGNGNIITEEREVSDFRAVSVSGSGSVEIIQGTEEHLQLEADENLLPYIESVVRGDTLHIRPTRNLRFTQQPRYQLKLRNLESLQLSGSLRANCDQLESTELRTGISGSGKIEFGKLQAQSLDINISGSGSLAFEAGSANTLDLSISGSGDFAGRRFEVERAKIRVSGSGSAKVNASDALDVHISGSGDVQYIGSPRTTTHISGSGKIRSLSD